MVQGVYQLNGGHDDQSRLIQNVQELDLFSQFFCVCRSYVFDVFINHGGCRRRRGIMLVFKKTDVDALIKKLEPTDEVVLVGDHGVYLMSFAEKGLKEEEKRTVVYADGCNPDTDENWYDTKDSEFGGNDGCDPVGTAQKIGLLLKGGRKDHLAIKLTKNTVKVYAP